MAFDFNSEFQKSGWELQKIKFDRKRDRYIATAKNEHGEEMEAWGPDARRATSNLLLNVVARNGMRTGSRKLAAWKTLFTDQMPQIAEAYSKAPFYDTKAAISFMELGRDAVHRAKAISEHLQVEIVNDPEPYKDAQKMCEDVRKRRRLKISRAGLEHPVWSREEEIAFRTCFDVFGYCSADSDFGWEGTNSAFAHYASLISTEAQKALFTESIAKSAYAAYYRAYGPAKVVVLPQFIEAAQRTENPHEGYPGIHPTQRIPPIETPRIKPLAAYDRDSRIDPRMAQKTADATLADPNAGWSSGVQTLPVNARLDYQDPLEVGTTQQLAKNIDTEWAALNQNDPTDLNKMKLAIMNAFRVVLLSPQKKLRFNAVHYQDLMHVDPYESDPTVYWHTLDKARQNWNVVRHGEQARYQHTPWRDQLKKFETLYYQQNPHLEYYDEAHSKMLHGWDAAVKKAFDFVWAIKLDLEEKEKAKVRDMDPEDQPDTFETENEVNKMLVPILEKILQTENPNYDWPSGHKLMEKYPEHQWGEVPAAGERPGQMALAAVNPEQEGLELSDPQADKTRYAGFIGLHLKSIAQVSQHVDELLKAALEDVHERRGTGHHFRSTVLQLGIPGIGPKVASFAWLLLQPMTSELATIDTHMAQWLGYKPSDVSPRDYFKMERQLRAGLDAAGYSDIKGGQGQWAAWDYKRSGPGQHQDHSPLKVLDPTPHDDPSHDWAATPTKPSTSYQPPQWWLDTLNIRNGIGEDYDQEHEDVPQNETPYQRLAKASATKVGATPWFEHPETHEQIMGQSEQTLMQHLRNTLGLPVEEVWKRFDDQNTGKLAKVARTASPMGRDHWFISVEQLQDLIKGKEVDAKPAGGGRGTQIMRPAEFESEDLEALAQGQPVKDVLGDWLQVGEPTTSERYHLKDQEERWEEDLYGEPGEPEDRPSHPATQMAMAHTGQIPGDEQLVNEDYPINVQEYNEMSGVNPSYFGTASHGSNLGDNPRKLMIKPEGIFHTNEEVSDLANERAAFAVAHRMGIPMPHTTVQQVHVPREIAHPDAMGNMHPLDTPAQVQEIVPGETAAASYREESEMPNDFSEDWRRIGLFDNVIGNPDRHTGNVMVNQNNRLIPIDHGGAFTERHGLVGFGYHYTGQPLTPEETESLQRVKGMDLAPMGIPPNRQKAFHDRVNQMLDTQAFL